MNLFLNIIQKTTLAIVLIIITTAALVMFPPKLKQWNGLEKQRDDLLRRINYIKHETSELKIKQQRFSSDREFVEHISRQSRRVRPGELVFVFESEPTD